MALADFEALALRQNPTLVAAQARFEAARGRWTQSGLYPNPIVGYHATQINNMGTAGQQGGFVQQRIVTANKLGLSKSAASQGIRAAEEQFSAQQLRVLTDVRIRFYDVLAAQERVNITRNLVKIADELVKSSRQLLAAGQVGENDVLQAEIEEQKTLIDVARANNQLEQAWQQLTAVTGMHMPLTTVQGDLRTNTTLQPFDDYLAELFGKSPELAAARAEVEQARWQLQRERKEVVPDIDVWVSLRHANFQISDDVVNVQVGVPIPVFNRNQGNIHRARAELAAAKSEIRRLELDLQDRLSATYRRYADARVEVDRYASGILPRARKSLELVGTGYRKRQVNYLLLLNSQQVYFRVSLAYVDALRDLNASAELLNGLLLNGGLRKQ